MIQTLIPNEIMLDSLLMELCPVCGYKMNISSGYLTCSCGVSIEVGTTISLKACFTMAMQKAKNTKPVNPVCFACHRPMFYQEPYWRCAFDSYYLSNKLAS